MFWVPGVRLCASGFLCGGVYACGHLGVKWELLGVGRQVGRQVIFFWNRVGGFGVWRGRAERVLGKVRRNDYLGLHNEEDDAGSDGAWDGLRVSLPC